MTPAAKPSSNPTRDALQAKIESLMFAAPLFHRPPLIRKETTKHIVQSTTYPFNELADEYFYNVSEDDKKAVHAQVQEAGVVVAGAVVCVPPGKAPAFFPDVYSFLTSRESREVGALCVPGVGSSVLGAVGLARDVSDARKVPALGIVTGYGLRELLNDAIGGSAFFRGTNQLEFLLENSRRSFSAIVAGLDLLPGIETYESLEGGPALQTVKTLLRDDHGRARLPNLQFGVGHSKGNMVLAAALAELFCENASIDHLHEVTIVLLSAICSLPEKLGKQQIQIIGALDMLGWANSRLGIPPTKVVPNTAHHLNRKIPFHLDAVALLQSL